jgi:hypothetical protein
MFQYWPVKAHSVPPCRVTWYCSGVRMAFHSASVFTIFSILTRPPSAANAPGFEARHHSFAVCPFAVLPQECTWRFQNRKSLNAMHSLRPIPASATFII